MVCDDEIFTFQRLSDVSRFLLRIVVLSELKIVESFLLKVQINQNSTVLLLKVG